MRRFISISSVIAITATLLVSGSVAATAETKVPASQLMNKADLKPYGGLKKPATSSWDLGAQDTNNVNSVCIDAKGQPILFPNAEGWLVGGRVKTKGYNDLTEFVRDYKTTEAQAAAWTALNTAFETCPATAREDIESGNPREYYTVKQTPKSVSNAIGLLVQQITVSPDRRINGSKTATYSVYSQSGTAIIEVIYYANPGRTIPAATIAKVNALSSNLSARWVS